MEGVVRLSAKAFGDGRHASGHESRYADVQLLELEIAALERDCAEKPLLLLRELRPRLGNRLAAGYQRREKLALHVHFAGTVLAALAVEARNLPDEIAQHRKTRCDLVGVVFAVFALSTRHAAKGYTIPRNGSPPI